MRLATLGSDGKTLAGVVVGSTIVPAHTLLRQAHPIADVGALLASDVDVISRLQEALDRRPAHEGAALATAVLRSPVLQPPTIRDFFCHEGHASMGGRWTLSDAWYRLPIFYFSNPLCVYGHGDPIPIPSATRRFDFELEVAAVIGRAGSNVPAAAAFDHIAGFTILNDWSCRDLQRDEMAAGLGPAKGKDAATSLGPFVVTCDELASRLLDGQLEADCRLLVNGVEWVRSATGNMQHDWGALIERASRDSRIVPGDIIGSGTVTGGSVAEAIRAGRPARYLQPGDEVEVVVDGLGTLANTIVASTVPLDRYRYAAPVREKVA